MHYMDYRSALWSTTSAWSSIIHYLLHLYSIELFSQLIIQSLRKSFQTCSTSSENHIRCQLLSNLPINPTSESYLHIAVLYTSEQCIRKWLRFLLLVTISQLTDSSCTHHHHFRQVERVLVQMHLCVIRQRVRDGNRQRRSTIAVRSIANTCERGLGARRKQHSFMSRMMFYHRLATYAYHSRVLHERSTCVWKIDLLDVRNHSLHDLLL